MLKTFVLPLVLNLALAALAAWFFIGSFDMDFAEGSWLQTLAAPLRPYFPTLSSNRSMVRLLIFGVLWLALSNVFKLLKAQLMDKGKPPAA